MIIVVPCFVKLDGHGRNGLAPCRWGASPWGIVVCCSARGPAHSSTSVIGGLYIVALPMRPRSCHTRPQIPISVLRLRSLGLEPGRITTVEHELDLAYTVAAAEPAGSFVVGDGVPISQSAGGSMCGFPRGPR